MLAKSVVCSCVSLAATIAIAMEGIGSGTLAQSASEVSMYQAGHNVGLRLKQEGFSLNRLEGAPYYEGFLESGKTQNVKVNVPSTGEYILVVGGDNDTRDLDVYVPQINVSDTGFGTTAFVHFEVYRPGQLLYSIDMQSCQAGNCGVFAVLLSVGD